MRPSLDLGWNPLVAIWETTRACDLACVHCRAEARIARDPLELSTRRASRFSTSSGTWRRASWS